MHTVTLQSAILYNVITCGAWLQCYRHSRNSRTVIGLFRSLDCFLLRTGKRGTMLSVIVHSSLMSCSTPGVYAMKSHSNSHHYHRHGNITNSVRAINRFYQHSRLCCCLNRAVCSVLCCIGWTVCMHQGLAAYNLFGTAICKTSAVQTHRHS